MTSKKQVDSWSNSCEESIFSLSCILPGLKDKTARGHSRKQQQPSYRVPSGGEIGLRWLWGRSCSQQARLGTCKLAFKAGGRQVWNSTVAQNWMENESLGLPPRSRGFQEVLTEAMDRVVWSLLWRDLWLIGIWVKFSHSTFLKCTVEGFQLSWKDLMVYF